MHKQHDMDKKSLHPEFLELLTPNYYKIHSFILTLVPHKTDSEDVLQSAITYMWEHFEDFKHGTNFLSWAYTISKYQVLTYRKKKRRSIVHFSEEAIALLESENQTLSRDIDDRLDALSTCLKKLPYKDLAFIKNRYEYKLSIRDMATEFGISVNIIYKRLAMIKALLLNCIHRATASGEAS
jgi:RNA polymerase sigma-70 factor (ECF subfamily)